MGGTGGVWDWIVYSACIIGRRLTAPVILTARTDGYFAAGAAGLPIFILVRVHFLLRASGGVRGMDADP